MHPPASPPPVRELPYPRMITSPAPGRDTSPVRQVVAVDTAALLLREKDDLALAYRALLSHFEALQETHEEVIRSQVLPLQGRIGELAQTLEDEVAHRDGLRLILSEKDQQLADMHAELQRQKLMEYVLAKKKDERIEKLETRLAAGGASAADGGNGSPSPRSSGRMGSLGKESSGSALDRVNTARTHTDHPTDAESQEGASTQALSRQAEGQGDGTGADGTQQPGSAQHHLGHGEGQGGSASDDEARDGARLYVSERGSAAGTAAGGGDGGSTAGAPGPGGHFTIAIEGTGGDGGDRQRGPGHAAEIDGSDHEREVDPSPSAMISTAIYEMEKKEFQNVNRTLQDHVDGLKGDLQTKTEEVDALRDQMAQHEGMLSLYKSRHTDVTDERAVLDAALKESEQQGEGLRQHLRAMRQQKEAEASQMKEHLCLLTEQLDSEKRSHEDSLKKIQEVQRDYSDVVNTLKRDLDAANSRANGLDDEREALQKVTGQLRQALSQAALEGHATENRVNTLLEENSGLQRQYQDELAHSSSLAGRLEAAEREREKSADELTRLGAEHQVVAEKVGGLEANNVRLEREAKDQERHRETEGRKHNMEAADLQQQLEAMLERLERSVTSQAGADEEIKRLQECLIKEKLATDEERRRSQAADEVCERLRLEAQRSRRDVAQLRAVLEHQSGIFEGIEGTLAESNRRIEEHERRMEEQAQLIEASRQVEEHLQQELAVKGQEVARLRHELEELTAQLEGRGATEAELRRTIGDLEGAVSHLKAKLTGMAHSVALAEDRVLLEERRAVAAEADSRMLAVKAASFEREVAGARGAAAAATAALASAPNSPLPQVQPRDVSPERERPTPAGPPSRRAALGVLHLPTTPQSLLAQYEEMRAQGASPSAAIAVVAGTPRGGRHRSVSPRRL